jgi:hypothetical protein
VLGWKKLGLEQSLGTRIVTYADDLVILCRRGKAEEALIRMRELMGKLKFTTVRLIREQNQLVVVRVAVRGALGGLQGA